MYEISLKGSSSWKGADNLSRKVFESLGIDARDIIEFDNGHVFKIAIFTTRKQKAERVRKAILRKGLKKVKLSIRRLLKKDWQDKWKEDFRTFSLTKRFDVVPEWEKEKYKGNKNPIYLQPGNSFGTGLHDTTRFMAEFIDQYRNKFKSFLDIGTGTGILSIIASKNKAKSIDVVDCDKKCIKTARYNFNLNGVGVAYCKVIDVKLFSIKKKYDFVAANIITNTLIKNYKKIKSLVKKGGYLAVSGVMMDNLDVIKESYSKDDLKLIKVKKGFCWAALLYKKEA